MNSFLWVVWALKHNWKLVFAFVMLDTLVWHVGTVPEGYTAGQGRWQQFSPSGPHGPFWGYEWRPVDRRLHVTLSFISSHPATKATLLSAKLWHLVCA